MPRPPGDPYSLARALGGARAETLLGSEPLPLAPKWLDHQWFERCFKDLESLLNTAQAAERTSDLVALAARSALTDVELSELTIFVALQRAYRELGVATFHIGRLSALSKEPRG